MDTILAYSVISVCFWYLLFDTIDPTKDVRKSLSFLLIVVFLARYQIVSFPSFPDRFFGFLIVTTIPAVVISHFVRRRRVKPPFVRANDPYKDYRFVFCLLLFIFVGYLLFRPPGDIRYDLTITIPAFLCLVFVAFFPLFQRSEICGNGIWDQGALHTWDEYDSYSWTTNVDRALVELKQKEKFREPFATRLVRLTVPLESGEAAKQLLEANLANSAAERAKA